MPLSSLAKDVLKKSGRPISETVTRQLGRKTSFGSIVNKVLREFEEKKAKQELMAESNELIEWHNCKYLVKAGDKMTCRRFFSMCSMDKCIPKYFEKKES